MHKEEKIKVGISIGDLNGIGGELIVKSFEDSRILDFCTPVVFASAKVFTFLKNHFNCDFRFTGINEINKAVHGKVNVVNIWKEHVDIKFGEEDKSIGKYAVKSFKAATKALKAGQIDILLTAPINKHNIQSETFNFPGHTDYLNQELNGESLMLMVSEGLKIGLLTDHIPVKDIASNISEELIISKVNTIYETLVKDFGIIKPKIALLGINPHTGDNGVIGEEDDSTLKPAIQKIKDQGKLVFGPYSADSFFGSDNYKNFDAVLAAYHDQGLIPFKTLSFGQGVNFTAGLDKIRTSPDHGTAYEIAGKGEANTNSFIEALFTGIQIYKNRSLYNSLSQNPLKKKAKKA
jgi:4-hydroxythreonine-4-phosphate dehydrogenase